MVNSASQALADFKNKQLGGLLGGTSSVVDPGPVGGSTMGVTAGDALNRTMPQKQSVQFLDSLTQQNQKTNDLLMQNIRNKQQATIPTANTGYRMGGGGGNNGAGGARGQYGLTVPAANSFNQLSSAFNRQFGHGISVNDGGRTYAQQQILYNAYLNGTGNLAAKPGTSVHESGLAMDWGGIGGVGSATHNWLRQNAAQFGWYWTGGSFSQIESWHWEYHPEWG